MSLTKFPNGISSFGMPVLGSGDEFVTTGNVFFVDSGHAQASDGGAAGTSPSNPFATLDFAVSQCTANNGDIVVVMPGHSEDPTASIGIDVAGVWVRGMGWGADRPTFTFGAAAATLACSAAGVRVSNLVFDLGTVAATVTNCITISAADVIVENCETIPHATSQFTNIVTMADVDRITLRNNRFRSLHTASSTSGVLIDNNDDIVIVGNEVSGHFTEHVLDGTTLASAGACDRATVAHNFFYNHSTTATDLVIDMHDSSTGIIAYNALASAATDGFAAGLDPGNCAVIQNYFWDTVDQSAGLNPSASAT